jgi:hypothetical protein
VGTVRLPVAAVFGLGAALALVIFGAGFALGQVAALRRVPPARSPVAGDFDPYPTYTVVTTDTPSPIPSPTAAPSPRPTPSPAASPAPAEPPVSAPTVTASPVPTPAPTIASVPTATPGPATTSIEFQVGARQYYAADVSLKAGSTISGSFTVQPEDVNFAIWISSPSHARLYSRNRVRGTYAFSFIVPATGQYALVFDNTYSARAAKTVALTYTIKGP